MENTLTRNITREEVQTKIVKDAMKRMREIMNNATITEAIIPVHEDFSNKVKESVDELVSTSNKTAHISDYIFTLYRREPNAGRVMLEVTKGRKGWAKHNGQ